MKLHEEFKLYETMWELDSAEQVDGLAEDSAFDINLYDGRKIRCTQCGTVCVYDDNDSIPQEFSSWSTVFGALCDACHRELNAYEAAADRFLAVSEDVAALDDLLQFEEGIDQVEEMIKAWNKAKKDPRFIFTSFDISEIEGNFIANALECNLKISPNVFKGGLEEGIKLSSKLQEAESSDITIIGCDLEEIIDHMQKWGRCPKLPYGWVIDNIDDTDSDSRIVFSHRRLPLAVWFYCQYYMGSSYDQCKYELDHYISIDDTEFDHDMETFTRPSPEDFVKRIFDLVTEFNGIWENSDEKNFVKNLRAAGYKRHK